MLQHSTIAITSWHFRLLDWYYSDSNTSLVCTHRSSKRPAVSFRVVYFYRWQIEKSIVTTNGPEFSGVCHQCHPTSRYVHWCYKCPPTKHESIKHITTSAKTLNKCKCIIKKSNILAKVKRWYTILNITVCAERRAL